MLGEYDEDSMMLDDKRADVILVNNAYDYDVTVINFEPQILSLTSLEKTVVVGDSMTVIANAFDVEGDELMYAWNDGSGNAIACDDINLTMLGECTFTVTVTMVPTVEIRVTVSDIQLRNESLILEYQYQRHL